MTGSQDSTPEPMPDKRGAFRLLSDYRVRDKPLLVRALPDSRDQGGAA